MPAYRSLIGAGLLLAFLSGCAMGPDTNEVEIVPYEAFEIRASVDPQSRYIDVELISQTDRPLCLHVQNWFFDGPAPIHFASEQVSIIFEARRYPVGDFNSGYIPAGYHRHYKVDPGETLGGRILAEHFNVETQLPPGPIEMEFLLRPTYCTAGDRIVGDD